MEQKHRITYDTKIESAFVVHLKDKQVAWRKANSINGNHGCIHFCQEDIEEIFAIVPTKKTVVEIVSDFYDADLPFGEVRMRTQSSSGGHNGLQSVENYLHTKGYCRLRIGVGRDLQADLTSYVIGRFSEKEKEILPAIIATAVEGIETWRKEGPQKAMNQLNRKNKNEEQNND